MSDTDKLVALLRSGHDYQAIYDEARRRMMRDVTGGFYDEHLAITAFEHGARAAITSLSTVEDTVTEEMVSPNDTPISRLYSIADGADPLRLVTVQAGDLRALVSEHRCMVASSIPVRSSEMKGVMRRAALQHSTPLEDER